MSHNSDLSHQNPEELFAAAIARFEAGESPEAILASYPAEQQAELQEFLQIVEATVQLQRTPVPRPSPARRVARKQAFLQAAAELKADHTAMTPLSAPPVTPPLLVKKAPSLFDRILEGWAAFQSSFAIRPMSLAPLMGVMVAVWLGGFGFATLAKASAPGDPGYVVKQWFWRQELYLTPEEKRGEVAARQEEEHAQVVAKAARDAQENQQFIQAEDTLIFHGYERNYMRIGSLNVLMTYEPGDNPITIEGTPGEGNLVHLIYQIVPGQPSVAGRPLVQGIAVRVLATQIVIPPTPTATATATAPPTDTPTALPTDTPVLPTATDETTSAPGDCVVSAPSGWAPYRIQAGQSLTELATRAGISVAELLQVNCLTSEALVADTLILAPAGIYIEPTPTLAPTENVTPTLETTPTTAVTATVEASPTAADNTLTPTTLPITPTVIMTTTIAPTAIVTATPTLAATVTPSATTEAPPTATGEATPSPTPTLISTPGATEGTPTPTSAASGTETPIATESVTGVATELATPGGQETSQPETATATPAPATDTPIPAEGATATPTTEVGPGAAPTATDTPMPTNRPTDVPTPPTDTPAPAIPTEAPTINSAGVKESTPASPAPTPLRTTAPMPTATRTLPPPNESPLRPPR